MTEIVFSVGCSVTECVVNWVPCWPWKDFAGPPETYWKTRWTSDFCPSDADGTLNSSSQPHNILRQRERKNTTYYSRRVDKEGWRRKIIHLHKIIVNKLYKTESLDSGCWLINVVSQYKGSLNYSDNPACILLLKCIIYTVCTAYNIIVKIGNIFMPFHWDRTVERRQEITGRREGSVMCKRPSDVNRSRVAVSTVALYVYALNTKLLAPT